MGEGLAAAREALGRNDWEAALDHATDARDDDPALAADAAADALWWLGRLEECIAERELAHRLFDERGDHRRAGQAAVWLYEHHLFVARAAMANAWLRRARRSLADEPECVEVGALLLREGEVAHGSGELDRALALGRDVLALARRVRSDDLEAEALQAMGRVLIDLGELDEGLGHLDEAMLLAVQGRLRPYSTGKVYCSLISACEEVGDLDRAAEWTEATMSWASRHPFAIFPGVCRLHRALVLKRRGSLAEAEREAERASEELRSSHHGFSAAALAELGDIQRRLGHLDRAEAAFDRARELCGSSCAELALLRLAQGRIDAAVAAISTCLRGAPEGGLARSRLLPIHVHVSIAAGDLDAARAAAAELDAILGRFDTPLLRATVLSTRGRLLLAEGDAAAARVELEQALDGWQALDIHYEIASALTLLGQACRESGDQDSAVHAFTRAAELFERIGAHVDAEAVLGSARPALPAGLTEREVEVLQLIATGRSNSDVAAELHLSPKTVSRHLSNIFTKIDVTSRSAATAFAFEHDLVRRPAGGPANI